MGMVVLKSGDILAVCKIQARGNGPAVAWLLLTLPSIT
jgi:hypothetical protein